MYVKSVVGSELQTVKLRIFAVLFDKFGVSAFFGDMSVRNNCYFISVFNG